MNFRGNLHASSEEKIQVLNFQNHFSQKPINKPVSNLNGYILEASISTPYQFQLKWFRALSFSRYLSKLKGCYFVSELTTKIIALVEVRLQNAVWVLTQPEAWAITWQGVWSFSWWNPLSYNFHKLLRLR